MKYINGKLQLMSDFEIRVLREERTDIDILIPTENRTVNLYLENFPEYLVSRMQFPMVKNIIFRFCTLEDNNICTIHLLRNIDLQSSIVNYEIDYENYYFELVDKSYYIEMTIKKKLSYS